MRVLLALVARDPIRPDAETPEAIVEQYARPRPRLAVHVADVRPDEVLEAADPLRVPVRDDEALFAPDEVHDHDGARVELAADVGQVVNARARVEEMRAGKVGLAPAQ